MTRRTRTPCAVLAAALVAGCTRGGASWLEPDWETVLVDDGDRGSVPGAAVPEPVAEAPTTLPDLARPGPLELSIEQAALLALRGNRDLRVAELAPVIAGAFELIERGPFAPEVFADARFDREEALETARSTGEQFPVRGDDTSLGAGVRQGLSTGTDVELGVTQDRSISDRAPEQQEARVGLTVTQALLRGFGPAANLAAVRQAELETQASRSELRGFIESLLAETEIAYWEYLLAQRTIDIFQRSLEVAQQQSDQVDQRIAVGVLPRTESAAARTEVAIREQALINARSELLGTRLRLLRLMNAPLDGAERRALTPTTEPATTTKPIDDLDERIAVAQRLRPDLNEARLRLDQNRLETIRTRNGLLPRLDLFVALGKTGYADTFTDSFRALDGSTYDFSVGVNFSQFLGDTTARGLHQAALASRQEAAAAVHNLEQLVELDVRLAANDVERSRQQIDATTTTRRLQEQTAQAEVERFDVGASTALLVAQAQRDLLQAQIAEVEAVANYRVTLVRLYVAEGSLLDRRGLRIE